ncbi:MAG TPA: phosphotransferase, partial [Ilumatobacteraceae bacterium]|nr:phosphotransferase [Ilumatobacteraceae bacterium]
LEGPTLLAQLLAGADEQALRDAGALLAELHDRLHRIPTMGGGPGTIVHLDLHPDNVMMTPDGPMVIDWANGADGPAELDVAMTWVVMEPVVQVFPEARPLLDGFLDAAGRDLAHRGLRAACDRRLADPNATESERSAIATLRATAT